MTADSAICSVCGAELERQSLEMTITHRGSLVLVTGVPADVCPQCGEQYLEPDVVNRVQETLGRGPADRMVEIPVFVYPKAS